MREKSVFSDAAFMPCVVSVTLLPPGERHVPSLVSVGVNWSTSSRSLSNFKAVKLNTFHLLSLQQTDFSESLSFVC